MIGLILFVVWVVSVVGAVSYYARETMDPTAPKEYKIESNPLFLYEGKKYRLRSSSSASDVGGVAYFYASNDSGYSNAAIGFACRSREIADYFSEQFKKLYFDAIYGGILKYEWCN